MRIAPAFDYSDRIGEEPRHVVSSSRLQEIRDQKMYPFFDQGGNDGNGDFQMNVRWVRHNHSSDSKSQSSRDFKSMNQIATEVIQFFLV